MGMLQLAGIVSGGGKQLARGLENTQQIMGYSMLQKERDEMERKRMDITYGRERGLLHERANIERGMMTDRAKLENDYAVKREETRFSHDQTIQEDREDAEKRKGISSRQFEREEKEKDRLADIEKAEKARLEKKEETDRRVREDIEKEKRTEAEKIRSERRSAAEKEKERQHNTGRDIVLESMRGQRPTSGGAAGKWDDQTKHRERVIAERIESYEKKMQFGQELTKEEKADYNNLVSQLNNMVGIPNKQRPTYQFPD